MKKIEKKNIIKFKKDADDILEECKGNYDNEIVVIGYNKDGDLEVNCTDGVKNSDTLWLLESLKLAILSDY